MKASFNCIAHLIGALFSPGRRAPARAFERHVVSVKRDLEARRAILDAVWRCLLETERGERLDLPALPRAIKEVRPALRAMSGAFRPEQADYLRDAVETMRANAFLHGARAEAIVQLNSLGTLLSERCPPASSAGQGDREPGPARQVSRDVR